ncbi:MAG: UxaA family hydrolase [Candidatus Hodarchaeota archaeon]
MKVTEFLGYRRQDGRVGIRNHVGIIPSVVCANTVVERIQQNVEGTVSILHTEGCTQVGEDYEQTVRTLVGLATHPNLASVLIVGWGCENILAKDLAKQIEELKKPVDWLVVQESGGFLKAIEKGSAIAQKMVFDVSKLRREPVDISELLVALECGGSDTTSGIASNPAVGVMSDLIVREGGSVILSETPEMIGAEHILARRSVNEKVGKDLIHIVKRFEENAKKMGVDIRGGQPTPGNIAGGLTSIEEKSLGAIQKGGSSPVQEVLEYAYRPAKKGLIVMDTPGRDPESVTGMLAAGAQMVVCTTGIGIPTGTPLTPTIKLTGNPKTQKMSEEIMDVDASAIIDGKKTIEDVGKELFEEVLAVASGRITKAEILGIGEIAIFRIGPTL